MTTDDEIRTMLRDAGVHDATDDHVRAVRQLAEAALFSPAVAVQAVAGAVDDFDSRVPRRRPLRRLWRSIVEGLQRQQLERQRYLHASPEIRDAYLAGYGHGLADAPLIRP